MEVPPFLHIVPRVALLLVCGMVLPVANAAAQYPFEFCDDFFKAAADQRDPYEERIETERHDFTQSAVTVGRGVFQIESGYSYEWHVENSQAHARE